MPTTVRRRTRPASPATRPQKVAKPGAVKHGRNSPSRHSSEAGRFRPGSIGGFPRHEADVSTADASVFSPQDHVPKPRKPWACRDKSQTCRPLATADPPGPSKVRNFSGVLTLRIHAAAELSGAPVIESAPDLGR